MNDNHPYHVGQKLVNDTLSVTDLDYTNSTY